jgi:hypothetical protein
MLAPKKKMALDKELNFCFGHDEVGIKFYYMRKQGFLIFIGRRVFSTAPLFDVSIGRSLAR